MTALRTRKITTFLFAVGLSAQILSSNAVAQQVAAHYDDMVHIKQGTYIPLFKDDQGVANVVVSSFYLDRYPVTNVQYRQFIVSNPKWDPSGIKPIFSDANYLHQFHSSDFRTIENQPVTNVSWFAARAYCRSKSKRLPKVNEWEYVGRASKDHPDGTVDPLFKQRILDWYSKPATSALPDVSDTESNYWGVHGMHGVVWELVSDFNTALVTGESRGDTDLDQKLFCGAGAASSADPGDYAAFMRYAMRSSYRPTYTLASMGFRCAADDIAETINQY